MIIGIAGRQRSGKDSLGRALIERLDFQRVAFADGIREFIRKVFGEWPADWIASDAFKERDVLRVEQPYVKAVRVVTGRELLQRIGTEAGRSIFGDDCWVNVALAKCRAPIEPLNYHRAIERGKETLRQLNEYAATGALPASKASPHYCITDVRYPNEVAAVRAAGGKILRLNRLDSLNTRHDFQNEGGVEQCDVEVADRVICGLPRSAHPSHYSGDVHSSETSLPDVSNDTIKYDMAITGSMTSNTEMGLLYAKAWLGESP